MVSNSLNFFKLSEFHAVFRLPSMLSKNTIVTDTLLDSLASQNYPTLDSGISNGTSVMNAHEGQP